MEASLLLPMLNPGVVDIPSIMQKSKQDTEFKAVCGTRIDVRYYHKSLKGFEVHHNLLSLKAPTSVKKPLPTADLDVMVRRTKSKYDLSYLDFNMSLHFSSYLPKLKRIFPSSSASYLRSLQFSSILKLPPHELNSAIQEPIYKHRP
jgi:hypothetical protein